MNLITPSSSYNALLRVLPRPLQRVVTKTMERAGDAEARRLAHTPPRHDRPRRLPPEVADRWLRERNAFPGRPSVVRHRAVYVAAGHGNDLRDYREPAMHYR